MKNTFGSSVSVTIYGESHGAEIGAVIDGLAPGIAVDEGFIAERLSLRRPHGSISTRRREEDTFRILSGVFNGRTTGTPICISIHNTDAQSGDYESTRWLARPGHADYTAYCKYHGFEDYRGGGHFSGRLTAALTAAGAVALSALKGKGVNIATHIKRLGGINDRDFALFDEDMDKLSSSVFPVLDDGAKEKMLESIENAAQAGDSIGGILETIVTGLPAGVGEPWFDTLEGTLAHILFSIPGIKGVEFGGGFGMADSRGSEYNDAFRMQEGRIVTASNNNGGVNGGISNGMPVVFRCAVKPTPSIFMEQDTVDMQRKENAVLSISGRHDPAIIHRARAVVDSAAALALCDQLALRFGTDYLGSAGEKLQGGLMDGVYWDILNSKRNIVLIGMPGSGKSTVGGILAERLSRKLIDTDELIVKNSGMAIPEIFSRYGEEHFRELERQAVLSASMQSGCVISTGGGAILKQENLDALRMNGILYFLDRPLEALLPTEDRPLSDSEEKLRILYEVRHPKYLAAADEVITACSSAEQAANIIESRHIK